MNEPHGTVRVDYAGPGGACEGIRSLGLESVGIEWDTAACATRAAAGHLTIRADLATYRPHHGPSSVEGYWSSPPCQTFSAAGNGDGREDLDALAATIHAQRWTDADLHDPRTRHVIDAARTAVELRPEWVAMEQVPAVLPLWRALAHVLDGLGYSTWTGVLCAADYGVPQTRRRAILMASRVRPVTTPTPTHAEHPGLFGEAPWVSMADALGWGKGQWVFREIQANGATRTMDQPAMTISASADNGNFRFQGPDPDDRPIRLTVADALTLQSFPDCYPVQGTKGKQFEQIGNAVPPLLARHIVAALTGTTP